MASSGNSRRCRRATSRASGASSSDEPSGSVADSGGALPLGARDGRLTRPRRGRCGVSRPVDLDQRLQARVDPAARSRVRLAFHIGGKGAAVSAAARHHDLTNVAVGLPDLQVDDAVGVLTRCARARKAAMSSGSPCSGTGAETARRASEREGTRGRSGSERRRGLQELACE